MSIKIFKQHGFSILRDDEESNQIKGICPFCGKKKFFINRENLLWDCKVCGTAGSKKTFLTEVNSHNLKLEGLDLALTFLGEIRGLKMRTLKEWNIGINEVTSEYSLPYYSPKDNKTVTNIKRYNPETKAFLSTSSTTSELFGAWKFQQDCEKVYLCEGEWDALAIWQALTETGEKSFSVLALPGASTWRDNWLTYFREKTVVACFDNDKAGRKGAEKLERNLSSVAYELLFINWERDTPDKYDVRDLMLSLPTPEAFLERVENLLSSEIPIEEKEKKKVAKIKKKEAFETGKFIAPADIYKQYQKWLRLESAEVIDVLYGSILANRLEGSPLWLFLVAPSGGAKSELLMSLSSAKETHATTTLTSSSLISGMQTKEGDPSLIPKLNNKVLIVKDFTTILSMNQSARDEIFGILRDAYDGKIEKMFGNGLNREYNSTFGLLSGTTEMIEVVAGSYVALGERFLRWYEPSPEDRIPVYLKVLENNGQGKAMREELTAIGKKVLSYDYPKDVSVSTEKAFELAHLAEFVSIVRGAIVRDERSGEISHSPIKELGTRLMGQFASLAKGVSMFYGKNVVEEKALQIVKKVAWFTIPSSLTKIIRALQKSQRELKMKELLFRTKLPERALERALEDLLTLGIVRVKRVKRGENRIDSSQNNTYQLSIKAVEHLEKSGLLSLLENNVFHN